MKLAAAAFAVALAIAVSHACAADPLVVHEWGTFTCLQDETGRAIGGINTDDEPVPGFVHTAGVPIGDSNQMVLSSGKGIYPNYPPVTMRLETPVIYFHRPTNSPPTSVSVDVTFHGGWLTQFYPQAKVSTSGMKSTGVITPPGLTTNTVGTLDWPAVQIGVTGKFPASDDKVWTTPREVHGDAVTVGGESEQFLFYRGVGHVDSPLRVLQTGRIGQLQITFLGLNLAKKADRAAEAELAHSPMWLVRVSPDGWVDWQRGYEPAAGAVGPDTLGVMDSRFLKTATHRTGAASLHQDMSAALVKAGLFPDEAEAMLNTWEVSYFKSPGLRLFYLLPRGWIDAKLPLHVTGNPPITRVMVGRIEIVTPEQRELIRQIESTPMATADTADTADAANAAEAQLAAGRPMIDAVRALSPAVRDYVLLGRFRNALLLDEQSRHPNAALADFLLHHGIYAAGGN
ncbi:MAG TPA: hypothetical protein VHY37_08520 [Tepidisphaeraceae bacterium]|jgi:hypothetical protein|nr:hypothetical protein [Tepidisphaeraceae bacterium]